MQSFIKQDGASAQNRGIGSKNLIKITNWGGCFEYTDMLVILGN